MSEENARIEARLTQLERRLAEFTSDLTTAADEQDKFIYNIAFSSAQLANGTLALITGCAVSIFFYLLSEPFMPRSWAVIAALIVFVAACGLGARGLWRSLQAQVRADHDALKPFPAWLNEDEASQANGK